MDYSSKYLKLRSPAYVISSRSSIQSQLLGVYGTACMPQLHFRYMYGVLVVFIFRIGVGAVRPDGCQPMEGYSPQIDVLVVKLKACQNSYCLNFGILNFRSCVVLRNFESLVNSGGVPFVVGHTRPLIPRPLKRRASRQAAATSYARSVEACRSFYRSPHTFLKNTHTTFVSRARVRVFTNHVRVKVRVSICLKQATACGFKIILRQWFCNDFVSGGNLAVAGVVVAHRNTTEAYVLQGLGVRTAHEPPHGIVGDKSPILVQSWDNRNQCRRAASLRRRLYLSPPCQVPLNVKCIIPI